MDSLVNYLTAWEALPASRWALGTIRSGFMLLGVPGGSPLFSPPTSTLQARTSGQQCFGRKSRFWSERCSLSDDLPFSGVFLGHLICVPKVQEASIREAVRPGDWGASLDLTDAYFQIPFAKADRKWLRLFGRTRNFQFRALPFGLSLAPWYSP